MDLNEFIMFSEENGCTPFEGCNKDDILTAGKLIELLQKQDPDTPVGFTNWEDGECHFISAAQTRQVLPSGEILTRDMEDDWTNVFVLY